MTGGVVDRTGFSKRMRGIIKQFFPYGMERRYILKTYAMTEPWDPVKNGGLLCFFRDLLPYGLVRRILKRRYERKEKMSLPLLTRLRLCGIRALRALHLVGGERFRLLHDCLVVEASGLFDADWYRAEYPDVVKSRVDPVRHYCSVGWRERRSPGPYFDGREYLRKNRDAAASEINPVVHFVLCGGKEGRDGVANAKSERRRAAARSQTALRYHPKISVIVASYNYEKFLPEALDSLLAQTYGNFEVIVVDDGSSDGSAAVARKYAERHANVFLHQHEGGVNRGLPATVKLGLSKATGEFVAFCESDDIWMPDHLLAKVSLLNDFGAEAPAVVVNDVQPFGDEVRCRAAAKVAEEILSVLRETRNPVSVMDFRRRNWICSFSCCMVRRDVLQDCDFDTCPRPANLDWWLWRQVCCTHPVYVVREKLTKWRMHESFMAKESMESILLNRQFLDRMDRLLLRRHPREAGELRRIVEQRDRFKVENGRLLDNGEAVAVQPKFSVVMPTYNRAFCIGCAIDSLLRQTYQNFELVIADDGSTDGTEKLVRERYGKELESGRIKYHYISNRGVCKARNYALKQVTGDWIAYLDSDNEMCDYFLEEFAREITCHPDARNLYAKLICRNSKKKVGHAFDLDLLLRENYIDLGVYVHHRSLLDEVGAFDENMTRLVDWDLIVRQAKAHEPLFIDEIVLIYSDDGDYGRITNSVLLKANMDYFRKKHCNWSTVTTVITTYNHEKYIRRAIESAIMQQGDFIHEIIVSNDASTDGTQAVIDSLKERYPGQFKDLSGTENVGISANLRRCFAAATGKYIAILEGDDYWVSPWKIARQVKFMGDHPKCSMCFSRIKLLDKNGNFALLPRQSGLPDILTGEDFIRDPNQNLIANFSCCMFRGDIVRSFPDILFSARFNEIACAFYMEREGPIGFLPDVMSVYRIHDHGAWSACDRAKQIESAIKAREVAFAVSAPRYQRRLRSIIGKLESNLKGIVKEHESK